MYQQITVDTQGTMLHVSLGHSLRDPEKHCNDGDSPYISGSFKNTLVRLVGIDAFEIRGLDIQKLLECGFLYVLDKQLKWYLMPKLTEESVRTHKELGFRATVYFEDILEEELLLSFESQFLDRYGRTLVNVSTRDNQDTYNLKLIKAGWAHPYFIYPNAVSPTEEGEWCYENLAAFRNAALQAKEDNLGIWPYINQILIPLELRFLTRREVPAKYCADLVSNLLYSPQYYFKIPLENRLFLYPEHVFTAIQKGFKPALECDAWLHRVWRVLQGKEENKVREKEREKRRELIKEKV
jgi:endonuclease YncB( thermonuclease family)